MIRYGTSSSSRRRPGSILAMGTGLRRCGGIDVGIAPQRRQYHPGRVGRPVGGELASLVRGDSVAKRAA